MSEADLWTDDKDELRRSFIFSHFPWSNEFTDRSQILAMEKIFQWLRHGRVPEKKGSTTKH